MEEGYLQSWKVKPKMAAYEAFLSVILSPLEWVFSVVNTSVIYCFDNKVNYVFEETDA